MTLSSNCRRNDKIESSSDTYCKSFDVVYMRQVRMFSLSPWISLFKCQNQAYASYPCAGANPNKSALRKEIMEEKQFTLSFCNGHELLLYKIISKPRKSPSNDASAWGVVKLASQLCSPVSD
ncbi:uncharacterized protein [Primulina huaijiensis]|uniref:uncharacterized protein n=1 Tax=Primulina huaijiensis TaxID=1492673 RepID=UPI003CC75B55